jgi:hypothetical protein
MLHDACVRARVSCYHSFLGLFYDVYVSIKKLNSA